MDPSKGVRVLEEQEDNRIPSEEEVLEYASYLEIKVEEEPHLMWIAREGVVAPVPPPWKMCTENDEDYFYFNFETGESVWDHPSDEKYREMVKEYREKALKEKSGGGDSIDSGTASKLDSKLDESAAGDEVSAADGPSKLDVSKDASSARDDVCKFEASALDSSLASAPLPELNSSKGELVVERGKRSLDEVSAASSSSSDSGISGPASPRSAASGDGVLNTAVLGSKDVKLEHKPAAADGAAGHSARADPSTPPRDLEESGADIAVELPEEVASQDSPVSSMASRGHSPLGSSAGKVKLTTSGGDDAAGSSQRHAAAVQGWESIVGKAAEESERRAVSKESQRSASKESQRSTGKDKESHSRQTAGRAQRAVAGWQRLADPLLAQAEEAAAEVEEKQPGAAPSLGAAPAAAPVPSGGSDNPSEVSEEYPSEFAGTSPAASHSGALGRSSPAQSGTPEPTHAAAAASEDKKLTPTPTLAFEAPQAAAGGLAAQPKLRTWAQVEAELASLSRCLTMLRDIRQKQAKFLELLNG